MLHKCFPKTEEKEELSNTCYEVSTQERKTTVQCPSRLLMLKSSENTSKCNSMAFLNNYTSQPSGVYPQNENDSTFENQSIY